MVGFDLLDVFILLDRLIEKLTGNKRRYEAMWPNVSSVRVVTFLCKENFVASCDV